MKEDIMHRPDEFKDDMLDYRDTGKHIEMKNTDFRFDTLSL